MNCSSRDAFYFADDRRTHRLSRSQNIFFSVALAIGIFSSSGCLHLRSRPPYDKGEEPSAQTLLASHVPRTHSVLIPDGKIRSGLRPAARFSLLAKFPGQMRAAIHFAGQEIVSLAFSNEQYTLRNSRAENVPRGFYHGPVSACAVSALLGIEVEPADLVAVVLGGGPQLSHDLKIGRQYWDRKQGHEHLDLCNENSGRCYEFGYIWHSGAYWLEFAKIYEHATNGSYWGFRKSNFELARGQLVARELEIFSGNNKKKDQSVVFSFLDVRPNPVIAAPVEEEDIWNDDGEWEGEDAGEPAQVPAKAAAKAPLGSFELDGQGLRIMGDLCREPVH